jgi:hypothetical protein
MSYVEEILAIDKSFRFSGVTDDLYGIESLTRDSESGECQVIIEPMLLNSLDKPTLVDSQGTFNESFFKKYDILKELDFSNIIVAGGAIRNVLLQEKDSASDIDIFLYGITNTVDATRKTDEIIRYIRQTIYHRKDYRNIVVTISNNVINIDIYDAKFGRKIGKYMKIQIIMRLYTSISEILHGFDLGASAVGFDGKTTYFTTLSKFAYLNMANIVDTTRRSTSYEYRLIKYFNYGFDIVLPNLNIEKYVDETYIDLKSETKKINLKYLSFGYSKIEKNKITITQFDKIPEISDYDISDLEFFVFEEEDVYEHVSIYINLQQIIKNKPLIYSMNLSEDVDYDEQSIYNVHEHNITEDKIKKLYQSLLRAFKKKRITIENIKQNFSIIDPKDIIEKLYFSNITAEQKQKYINMLIQQQTIATIKMATPYFGHKYVPKWIIVNPMSQISHSMLSGSFNPIIEDNKQWYGY